MASEKVDTANLQDACQKMARLIEDMKNNGGIAIRMAFDDIANEIRFELDGTESCVPAVRERALKLSRR